MKIKLATVFEVNKIIEFFERYLDKENPAITGREFFLPIWTESRSAKKSSYDSFR